MKAVSLVISSVLCLNLFAAGTVAKATDQLLVKNIMKNAKVIHEEVQLSYASPSELKRALEHMRAAKDLIMGNNLDDDFSSGFCAVRRKHINSPPG